MSIGLVGQRILTRAGGTSGTLTVNLTNNLGGGTSASPHAGDLVLAIYAAASDGDRALTITDGTTPYTLIDSELFADDIIDTNLRVAYKFMGATPDESVIFGPTGNVANAGAVAVLVFSGVDPATPLDVAAVPSTGINTGRPNPAAITPVTPGAEIVVIGAGGSPSSGAPFTSSDLTVFTTTTNPATQAISFGAGRESWTSGAFDPAQFGGGASSTNASWAAMTLALRPGSSPADAQGALPGESVSAPAVAVIGGANAAAALAAITVSVLTVAVAASAVIAAPLPSAQASPPQATVTGSAAVSGSMPGATYTKPSGTAGVVTLAETTLPGLAVSAPAASVATDFRFSVPLPGLTTTPPQANVSYGSVIQAPLPAFTVTVPAVQVSVSVHIQGVLAGIRVTPPLATAGAPAVTPPERILTFAPSLAANRAIEFPASRRAARTLDLE